jgi:DedD protein
MPDSREPQLDDLRRRARRRLVGAIVLALAAAVLVPMLLESDPKPLGEDVAVKIPPIDDGKFVSKVGDKGKSSDPAPAAAPKPEAKSDPAASAAPSATDATKAPADAPKDAASAATSPGSPAAKSLASAEQRVLAPSSKAVPAATKPAPVAASKDAAPPTEAKAADSVPKPAEADKAGAFAVQLAAFIDDKGANSLAGKLKNSGYPAYTEPYETSRGTLWRVRVGPYPSRDAAEGVRAKLKTEGQNGIIAAAK